MRIAIVDDNAEELDVDLDRAVPAGYACHSFSTPDQLIGALRRESFDLLIVDWGSPGISGLEMVSWVRRNVSDPVPILFLTRRANAADIEMALDSGVDDYAVKPIQPVILRAKIAALLRRGQAHRPPSRVIAFEDYVFHTAAEIVVVGGKPISLTSKEFGLALLMFQSMHRALSRSFLLEAIWDRNPDLPTRTLDMHISRIRSKLRFDAVHGYRLTSIHSYGYRLDRLGSARPVTSSGTQESHGRVNQGVRHQSSTRTLTTGRQSHRGRKAPQ